MQIIICVDYIWFIGGNKEHDWWRLDAEQDTGRGPEQIRYYRLIQLIHRRFMWMNYGGIKHCESYDCDIEERGLMYFSHVEEWMSTSF